MLRPLSAAFSRPLLGLLVASALAAVSTVSARAQGDAPVAPPDTVLTPAGSASDSTPPPTPTLVLPPPASATPMAQGSDTSYAYPNLFDLRTRDDIQRDVDVQARVRVVAQRLMVDARALQTRRKYDADIKKTEIDAAKKRLDLAKKEKRQSDVPALEANRKRLEAEKDYLEKLRDAAGAEADFQQSVIDYASAREAVARAEQAVIGLGDFNSAELRATSASRTAQGRWNDALKSRAAAGSTMADREKTLCDRRKSAMDAWVKINAKG